MTNFDKFLSAAEFESFASVAVAAERILHIDPSACVLNCRRAMEFAVKWMYSVDKALVMPYQDTLVSLMNAEDFRDIVGADIWRRMDFIRRAGNNAAHTGKEITEEQAALCLENLYLFLDFVAYCYGKNYTEGHFDRSLLTQPAETPAAPAPEVPEADLASLMAENAALKEELTARRAAQQPNYVPKPLDLSEYKTRKLYIDTMLADAGWTEGQDWLNEVELSGMPNKSDVGYADYVLYGDDGRPLAVIEAKRTCVDVAKGRQQAKLYADLLEKKYHRRPVIFLTNGFETRITDNLYPVRRHLLQARSGKAVQSPDHADEPEKRHGGSRHCRTVLSGGRDQSGLRCLCPKPPQGSSGHGDRLRKDADGHCAVRCAAPARVGKEHSVSRRPQQSCHAGQTQLCKSAAQPFRHKSL